MILTRPTRYIVTDAPTGFGVFAMPSFREPPLFDWISRSFGLEWAAFEPPADAAHRGALGGTSFSDIEFQ